MTYYILDDDGETFLPMDREEMVRSYHQHADEMPTSLADLYVDFHDFDRHEFLEFKDRLSSAVLISRAARRGIDEALAKFEAQKGDRSHRVPGWETESDIVLDETLGVTRDSYEISVGATIVTAVAALEGLLIDLLGDADSPRRGGLIPRLKAFLHQQHVPTEEAQGILEMAKAVADPRNAFAHSLTGSPWHTSGEEVTFTAETMENILFAVGRLAVLLEDIVLA